MIRIKRECREVKEEGENATNDKIKKKTNGTPQAKKKDTSKKVEPIKVNMVKTP